MLSLLNMFNYKIMNFQKNKTVFNFIIVFGLLVFLSTVSFAQNRVYQTFKDRKIINVHSTETLDKYRFDFRIAHRFGDIAGERGGWQSFYGFDNASDISFGLDYGVTDKIMVGINRTKGTGELLNNVNAFFKYRLLDQEEKGNNSVSLAFLGLTSYSTMGKSESRGDFNYFDKYAHRFSYHLQVLLARKFSDYFSLQLGGAWTYRNIVSTLDKNDLPSVSLASKIQFTKVFGLILEGTYVFSEFRNNTGEYFPMMGVGFEWETGGGHVFQINVTNAKGLVETDYIPYTRSDWTKGEFRLGFTISRVFKI